MKKKWLRVVSFIILALMAVSLISCKDQDSSQDEPQGHLQIESLYIADQKECYKSDVLVYRFKVIDDEQATAFKYSIDHKNEVAVSGRVSESDESGEMLYTFDSGAKVINLSGLEAGTHVITFYLYQDIVRITIYTHVFEVKT